MQVGITNGIGSQSRWLNLIGHDDRVTITNECAEFQLEKDEYRVQAMEMGFFSEGTDA